MAETTDLKSVKCGFDSHLSYPLEKKIKKMLDRLNNPDYLDALDKIDQIISKQNPNLN